MTHGASRRARSGSDRRFVRMSNALRFSLLTGQQRVREIHPGHAPACAVSSHPRHARPQPSLAITPVILLLASALSRLLAAPRPRAAGVTALTGPQTSPVLGFIGWPGAPPVSRSQP